MGGRGRTGGAGRGNPRLHPGWTDPRRTGLVRLRRAMEEAIERHVSSLTAPVAGRTAVDMGCGTMPYRTLFAPHVGRYVGADLPTNPSANLQMDPKTCRLPLPSGSADIVVSTQVLEHLENPSLYLAEAGRLCKPDGLLFVSTHGFWPYHPDPKDYWRWTGEGLRKLLVDSGWNVAELTGVLGMASVSACLFQDALAPKLPGFLQGAFTVGMQRVAALLDAFDTPGGRERNAAVFLAVARCRSGVSA